MYDTFTHCHQQVFIFERCLYFNTHTFVFVAYSIKFATDLVVFPLLWLYRLARLTKIKFRKLLGRGGGGKSYKKQSRSRGEAVNGSSGGGGPNGAVDWKNFKANGE
jgi:uncharacterized membrane protein YgcG